jgi:hypothetical protein
METEKIALALMLTLLVAALFVSFTSRVTGNIIMDVESVAGAGAGAFILVVFLIAMLYIFKTLLYGKPMKMEYQERI